MDDKGVMISIEEYRISFRKSLESIYDATEIDNILKLIVKSYFGWNSVFFALNRHRVLSKDEYNKLKNALIILESGKPVQYLLNECEFMGNLFYVNKSVLIPRPETEELVNHILTENFPTKNNPLKVLDIGTGSGCIAVSIAKFNPFFHVDAIDFSSEAITIAKKNSKLMGVEINFKKTNILELNKLDKNYDIIVSNPPYVELKDKKIMGNNVLDFEPHEAIFVNNNDPLIYYKKIIFLADQIKRNNCKIYFEINPKFCDKLKNHFLSTSYNKVVIECDIFGKERIIKASTI